MAAHSQDALPTLQYDPPAGFYRSATSPPEKYSSNEVNAGLQVYPFRRFTGDIVAQLRRTLLRGVDRSAIPGKPTSRWPPPAQFGRDTVPGAEAVFTARFIENVTGTFREHMRIVIVAKGAAAIIDASANSAYSWQRAGPAMRATLASLRVETTRAAPRVLEPVSAEAAELAGVYMGIKGHYVIDLNRPVGYGRWVSAPHFYFFSADGRVHRTFDPPGGDPSRFDFDAAQRSDPENSGYFTIESDRLVMVLGSGQRPERITTERPEGNRVAIDTVVYRRQ